MRGRGAGAQGQYEFPVGASHSSFVSSKTLHGLYSVILQFSKSGFIFPRVETSFKPSDNSVLNYQSPVGQTLEIKLFFDSFLPLSPCLQIIVNFIKTKCTSVMPNKG